ncbi:hypothetical protein ACFCWY_08565 [Streptomyces sp. NPDC056362]|uniref:hypothetical protein n=1 Tax=unclassified Streptomyces TaxID=2593676 RepID=UPI0035DB03DC
MTRVTRAHTIRTHLRNGGLVDLRLDPEEQLAGPAAQDTNGFSLRQHTEADGTLVVIAAAFGPDWFGTLTMISHRLEQPYVKCHVTGESPVLAENELLVRWATSEELRARRAYEEQRQAPLKAALRRQAAVQRAEEGRQALEDSGQSGLF